MSNEVARLARQLAEHVMEADYTSPKAVAAAERIMATTTDPLTMADVDWNWEDHAFSGAVIKLDMGPTEVVMLSEGWDDLLNFALLDGRVGQQTKDRFTPNGKQYELVEVTDRPEVLVTVEDYENAPEGTVVALPGDLPWVKTEGLWRSPVFRDSSNALAATVFNARAVLRWGDGRMSRHPDWPKRWRVWKDQGDWFVISPEYAERYFPTHAEALAYADRMARTREYVLPRPQLNEDGYVEFDFTEWAGLDYTPEWPDGATYDSRKGPNEPAFGASVRIPREHWKPLANALHALAEQEKA